MKEAALPNITTTIVRIKAYTVYPTPRRDSREPEKSGRSRWCSGCTITTIAKRRKVRLVKIVSSLFGQQ
jgi:hypothetical protein